MYFVVFAYSLPCVRNIFFFRMTPYSSTEIYFFKCWFRWYILLKLLTNLQMFWKLLQVDFDPFLKALVGVSKFGLCFWIFLPTLSEFWLIKVFGCDIITKLIIEWDCVFKLTQKASKSSSKLFDVTCFFFALDHSNRGVNENCSELLVLTVVKLFQSNERSRKEEYVLISHYSLKKSVLLKLLQFRNLTIHCFWLNHGTKNGRGAWDIT